MRSRRGWRIGLVEKLECRLPLSAEGSLYQLSQSYDTSGLGGQITAAVEWGDGSSSAGAIASQPAQGALRFRFDYSTDTSGFFADTNRRNVLQRVADSITTKWSDTLAAIAPSGGNQWTATFQNPSTGASDSRSNLSIASNEILVFVGARSLGTPLGIANRGGFSLSATSQTFVDTVRYRGQTGAGATPPTDFGPWGGSLVFDSADPWHFGLTTVGLDANEFDFASVAAHELLHMLGFGLSGSFDAKLTASGFVGASTVAIAGVNPVPMQDGDHFASSLQSNGQQTLMSTSVTAGQRKLPTRLDLAALQDVGWQLINPQVQVVASHVYGDNGSLSGRVRLQGSLYGERLVPFSVTTTNVSPTLEQPAAQSAQVGVPLVLQSIGVFSDPGFGMPNAPSPSAERFTFSIDWGDGSPMERGSATITSLGSASNPTRGRFGGQHTYDRVGSFTATITVEDDDGGRSARQFAVLVAGAPSLAIRIDRTTIPENAGPNSAVLTLERSGFSLNNPLEVTLFSSDSTEVAIPATVTLPAGVASVQVPVRAVDDSLMDGSVSVQLRAQAGAVVSNVLSVNVTDHETLSLTATRSSFREDEGAGVSVLTVARSNSDTQLPITVSLVSSDLSELSLPSSVVIPAGQASVTVGVSAVDDNLFDGSQSVQVTVTESRYVGSSLTFVVGDYQPLQMVLQDKRQLNEDIPSERAGTVILTVRSPAPPGGVSISLTVDRPSELSVPASVRLNAGERQVAIPVQAIDDFVVEGARTVRISASGQGVEAAALDILITEQDQPFWTNVGDEFDVNDDGSIDPLDALSIINAINLGGSRILRPDKDLDLDFVDINMDGSLDPLDALEMINRLNRPA
ncbi:dockerin type I domain-containing protein [Pirellulaceae bacterium SH501]